MYLAKKRRNFYSYFFKLLLDRFNIFFSINPIYLSRTNDGITSESIYKSCEYECLKTFKKIVNLLDKYIKILLHYEFLKIKFIV